MGAAGTPLDIERLLVTARPGRRVPLSLKRVIRIRWNRNEAVFHTEDREYWLRTTLKALEARLDPYRDRMERFR